MNIALVTALLGFFALSVPVAVSIGLAAITGILWAGKPSMLVVPQKIFTSLDSFPLLAVPFFILAGQLMSRGGVSRRLVDFAKSLVGGMQGGLASTCVVTCMIFAAISMIQRKAQPKTGASASSRLVFIGLLVGLVTGFLGAGGGFLIVPALLFYGRLDLKYAIATSVFIITTNSLIGFIGDLVNNVQFDKMLLVKVSSMAIVGMFLGIAMSRKIDGKKLKPLFGWFVLTMGLFIIAKEIFHF